MEVLKNNIASLNDFDINVYEKCLLKQNITLNETEILLNCIEYKNEKFFKNFINYKLENNEIFYCDFELIFNDIIKYDYINYLNFLNHILNIHNINFYININNIIEIIITYKKYEFICYIINNNILDFKNNYYEFYLKILKLSNNENVLNCLIKNIFDKLDFNELYNFDLINNYEFDINYLFLDFYLELDDKLFIQLFNYL